MFTIQNYYSDRRHSPNNFLNRKTKNDFTNRFEKQFGLKSQSKNVAYVKKQNMSKHAILNRIYISNSL